MDIKKIFVYSKDDIRDCIYLHGPDNADPNVLLKLYVDWYNNDYLEKTDNKRKIDYSDYHFCNSFCPIDFSDDYKDLFNDK